MSSSQILLGIVTASYAAAFLIHLYYFLSASEKKNSAAAHFIEIGFLFHTLEIFSETFQAHQNIAAHFFLPVTTVGEASGFFAWSLAFVYLILVRRLKTESFGLVLAPVLFLFLIPAFFPFNPIPIHEYFKNVYFLLHILSAFFGYAGFALSFIAGLLYLAQDFVLKRKLAWHIHHKLPPLEDLERLIFRTIFLGVLLLGFAMVVGVLWSKSAFGSFGLAEPKSIASLLTWCVYLGIIYLHEISLVKGRRMVLISTAAFVLVVFTFWGTSLFPSAHHAGIG